MLAFSNHSSFHLDFFFSCGLAEHKSKDQSFTSNAMYLNLVFKMSLWEFIWLCSYVTFNLTLFSRQDRI